MNYEKIYEIIARADNTTVEEVKQNIKEALEYSDLYGQGIGDIDEFIEILTNRVEEDIKKELVEMFINILHYLYSRNSYKNHKI